MFRALLITAGVFASAFLILIALIAYGLYQDSRYDITNFVMESDTIDFEREFGFPEFCFAHTIATRRWIERRFAGYEIGGRATLFLDFDYEATIIGIDHQNKKTAVFSYNTFKIEFAQPSGCHRHPMLKIRKRGDIYFVEVS